MIWKDYLKFSEIARYSKLAQASKAPPPPPPGGIGLMHHLHSSEFLTHRKGQPKPESEFGSPKYFTFFKNTFLN